MLKSERQNESIGKATANDFHGILNLCIRFGKTRIGLKLAELYTLSKNKPTFILVPSVAVKQAWINEIEATGICKDAIIITAHQMLSYNGNTKIGLLIVDEVHKFLSEDFYKMIDGTKIKYDSIIMLTGTLPSKDKLEKLTKLAPIIDTITESEAVNNSWVSDYVEYNIGLDLSEKDKEKYANYTKVLSTIFSKYNNIYKSITYDGTYIFKSDLDLILACINGKNTKDYGFIHGNLIREAVSQRMNFDGTPDHIWHPDLIRIECKKFNASMRNRNFILASNELKLECVLYIYEKLQLPTICFSEYVEFANDIADRINEKFNKIAIAYHSKTESKPLIDPTTGKYYTYGGGAKAGQPRVFSAKKQLEYTVEAFKYDLMRVISTVKSLDEGFTIPEIECIITTAGSVDPIKHEQRTGRGKTFTTNEKITRIYNLYFNDFDYEGVEYRSRDKEKLYERQRFNSNMKQIILTDI